MGGRSPRLKGRGPIGTADAVYDKEAELWVLGSTDGSLTAEVWAVEELLDGMPKMEPIVPAGYKLLGPLKTFMIPKRVIDLGVV